MAWVNTSPLVKTYTLEEFWALPDPPDHSKLELIAGVLYMSPPPEYTHDNVVGRLNLLLAAEIIRLGLTGRLLTPRAAIWTSARTYLEPDLFYLSKETEARLDPARRTTADLVIEVVSPGSAIYDRNTKSDTYAALGVKELWLVDEKQETVEVRRLRGDRYDEGRLLVGGDDLGSSVIPGLAIEVKKIFSD
ncbi:MAG TPA: Uma2 family endonuclease [Pyrinomonadaceae bacterium]|jgi:Uma2 family endonuclease|nr:Uma2 family endonuclease [Pyrinomonadaceae bacterium]